MHDGTTDHMIRLRSMRADELSHFITYFVPDYAREISANYDEDIVTAHARAANEVKTELSLGVDTPGQVLLCIVTSDNESDSPAGYLWCKPEQDGTIVFINELYVFPAHRGNGYAKLALIELEKLFAETGHNEARLRVAADNNEAKRLYVSAGYRVTGINMKKSFNR